jgi:hypothetical protein
VTDMGLVLVGGGCHGGRVSVLQES